MTTKKPDSDSRITENPFLAEASGSSSRIERAFGRFRRPLPPRRIDGRSRSRLPLRRGRADRIERPSSTASMLPRRSKSSRPSASHRPRSGRSQGLVEAAPKAIKEGVSPRGSPPRIKKTVEEVGGNGSSTSQVIRFVWNFSVLGEGFRPRPCRPLGAAFFHGRAVYTWQTKKPQPKARLYGGDFLGVRPCFDPKQWVPHPSTSLKVTPAQAWARPEGSLTLNCPASSGSFPGLLG